jgi:class 3 adenylate cyclase/CHASE2 domain-containing sensor protein
MDEDSIKRVWDGSLGYRFGMYWPRQVYGGLIQELSAQGARAVALDIIFGELRPDHPGVTLTNGWTDSDGFFAGQMRRASNVILAISQDVTPPALFLTNAFAVGDITTDKDQPEGILRRARAFRTYRHWHSAFLQMQDDPDFKVDLHKARVEPRQIVLPRDTKEQPRELKFPLDENGDFDLGDVGGPAVAGRKAKPFTEERVWHMGIVLAARELQLDLANAEVDLEHGRVALRGPRGLVRLVPVDRDGYFYVDWCITDEDPHLMTVPIQDVLLQYHHRLLGTNDLPSPWRDKLVVVGSSAVVGNNLTDRGATPVRADTMLVSKHWNVANSLIMGRFVHRSPLGVDLLLILLLGAGAAMLTWELPVLRAPVLVFLLIGAYVAIAFVLYIRTRYWIPLVLPVGGACLVTHLSLVTWRVVFEEAERRRVKAVLCTMVSPKIAEVVLQSEKLSLGGARREVSVLFADVRGFTQFTDLSQERAAAFVEKNHLTGPAAEACYDEQARETIATINLYLGLVANTLLQGDCTLDKFIGDCVMAFWGDPKPEPKHALASVRAAIEAQRAIHELNWQREDENRRRTTENKTRQAAGLPPQELLPILFLGTGINTGMVTVGMMGAEVKQVVRQGNVTVFGREVNLASRLEGASGRGRIFIGETTYRHLLRDDPDLAATCVALPAQRLKGISSAVTVYEVPWRLPGVPTLEAESTAATPDTTAFIARG